MKTKALLGILAGVAAGAAIGMLFAPNKGVRTRRKIYKKSKSLAKAINRSIDDKFGDTFKELNSVVTLLKEEQARIKALKP